MAGKLTARDAPTIDNDRRGYVSGRALEGVVMSAVTDEALQAAYDARFKDAAPQTEYSAAHILVEDEEKAAELLAQAGRRGRFRRTGQGQFHRYRVGRQWRRSGLVRPGHDGQALRRGRRRRRGRQVSGPVKTDFGWHLILVKETRVAAQPTLDDLRDELAAEIEQQAIDDKIAE
jgi:peptidyl-prolyl cis-trans isomerase C